MTDQTTAVTPYDEGDSRLSFGQTQMRPQDMVMPRVKIAQQMSLEVADKKAEAGDFYNTLTGESYGSELRVQPILPFMQRVLLVRDERRSKIEDALGSEISEGDGLKCRSFDMVQGQGEPGILCEECPLSRWNGNEPPLCTETYNVAGSNEIGELIIVSFSKSSAKVGKRLFSAIRLRPGAPWASFFKLTTTQARNDKGVFYVPDFVIDKERPDTGQLKQATEWAQQLRGVRIDVTPDEDLDTDVPEVDGQKAPF